jgi:hypothetical protein
LTNGLGSPAPVVCGVIQRALLESGGVLIPGRDDDGVRSPVLEGVRRGGTGGRGDFVGDWGSRLFVFPGPGEAMLRDILRGLRDWEIGGGGGGG